MQITNNIQKVDTLVQGETVNVGGITVNAGSSPDDFVRAVAHLREEINQLPLPREAREQVIEELRRAEQAPLTNGKATQGFLERAKTLLTSIGGTVEAVTSIAEKLAGLAILASSIF